MCIFFQNLCLFSMMVLMLFNSHCYLRRFLILQTLPPTWLIMALLQSNICSINKAQTLGSVRITWRGSKYAHLWALSPRILNQYMWGLELKICILEKLQLMISDDILSNIFLLYNHVPYRRGGNPCRFVTIRSVALFCSALLQHTMPWPSYSCIYSPIVNWLLVKISLAPSHWMDIARIKKQEYFSFSSLIINLFFFSFKSYIIHYWDSDAFLVSIKFYGIVDFQ